MIEELQEVSETVLVLKLWDRGAEVCGSLGILKHGGLLHNCSVDSTGYVLKKPLLENGMVMVR